MLNENYCLKISYPGLTKKIRRVYNKSEPDSDIDDNNSDHDL